MPVRVAPVSPAFNTAAFGVTDLSIGLAASKSVSCAFEDFVDRAVALADPERRRAMGAAARRGAEARTTAMVARQYVDFFAGVSAEAQARWTGDGFRPLLEMDRVLGVQTAGRLQSGDRLAAGNLALAGLLSEGWQAEDGGQIALALSGFEGGRQATIGQLAAQLAPADSRLGYRLIVRLLNYGVLRRVG